MDTLAIIKRIEMRLSQLGMSKADFYSRSGISSASFSQWRTGTYKPSRKKLEKAADVLAVPVGYLLGSVTMNDDGCSFSDGSGYGGGYASGAGFGDGSGYGGPMPRINTKKAPTVSGERSVSDDEIKFALFGGDGEITDAMYEEVRRFAAFVKQREADKKKE